MSSELLTPIITVVGIIGSAYLTYLATTYRYRNKPKDPSAELFNYYDQLIKNMWEQNEQKDKMIKRLEESLERIQAELTSTKDMLSQVKEDYARATREGKAVQETIIQARSAINN